MKSINAISTVSIISCVIFLLSYLIYWPLTLPHRDTSKLTAAIASHPSDDKLKDVASSVESMLKGSMDASTYVAGAVSIYALFMTLAWLGCLFSIRKLKKTLSEEPDQSKAIHAQES